MTRRYSGGEVLPGVQGRRRWTPEEKIQIVEETYLPRMSVSLVARQHGVSGSQIFTWRRLMNQSALAATAAGEEVVPASDYRALMAEFLEVMRCTVASNDRGRGGRMQLGGCDHPYTRLASPGEGMET